MPWRKMGDVLNGYLAPPRRGIQPGSPHNSRRGSRAIRHFLALGFGSGETCAGRHLDTGNLDFRTGGEVTVEPLVRSLEGLAQYARGKSVAAIHLHWPLLANVTQRKAVLDVNLTTAKPLSLQRLQRMLLKRAEGLPEAVYARSDKCPMPTLDTINPYDGVTHAHCAEDASQPGHINCRAAECLSDRGAV